MACELCDGPGGDVLWRGDIGRVVLVDAAGLPGFCRVVLERHAPEMTDLGARERDDLMRVVFAVERAVRTACRPDKVNLASLGNVTPHVHWHVIPRWLDDAHFPDPIWAPARRPAAPRALDARARAALVSILAAELGEP